MLDNCSKMKDLLKSEIKKLHYDINIKTYMCYIVNRNK